MNPAIATIEAIATVLWVWAIMLGFLWFRAVGRRAKNEHVENFVALMGVLVPVIAAIMALIFAGAFLGLPSVVVFIAMVVPAGLTIALQLEVTRLEPTDLRREASRIGFVLVVAVPVIWVRQFA